MDKERIKNPDAVEEFWEDFNESMLSTDFGILEEKAVPSSARLDDRSTSQQIEFKIYSHTPLRINLSIQF